MADLEPPANRRAGRFARGAARWFPLVLAHVFVLQVIVLLVRVATSYRAVELELSAFWIGVISGSFAILPALLSLQLGWLIDRWGETTPLRLGAGLVLVATLAFWLGATSIASLIFCNVVLGLGNLISVASEHSMIGRAAPGGRRDSYFGYYTVAVSAGQAIGPSLIVLFSNGGLLPDTTGIFGASGGIAVALLIFALLIRAPANEIEPQTASASARFAILLRTPGFSAAVLSSLIVFSAMDMLIIFLPVFGAENGISAAVIGYMLALRAAASAASRLLFGSLVRLLGRGPLLISSMLASGVALALVPISDSPMLWGAELAIVGFCLGLGAPLTLSWVSEIAPPGMAGTALALRLAGNRFAQVIIPALGGVAVAAMGAGGGLIAIAAALSASALIAGRFLKVI